MKAKPTLKIELNVTCPTCDYDFDIFEETNRDEDGEISKEIMPTNGECWSTAHDTFLSFVECPNCRVDFDIEGVNY